VNMSNKIHVGDPVDFCRVFVTLQVIVPVGCEAAARRALADDLRDAVYNEGLDGGYFCVDAADEEIGWGDVSIWACGGLVDETEREEEVEK